ncbi:hypothetical protein EA187_04780 [Lujinxingia sediminis]|uniref:Uncharacterized protein n=1 Tax=Lujinxingia sediminis TaxID=2480984 RepID=A0ABY0CYF7_9DELT|nr:hypothetical protein [Lujinxingia sediminis]RVU48749.1 hypothetical protein EA187_04780 [Lujinxingia sediminis]
MNDWSRVGALLLIAMQGALGCASTPGAADTFAITMRVQPDDRISDSAALTLLEDGTWSMQADRGESWRWDFQAGDVARFEGGEHGHLFVVLDAQEEHLRLQRLDTWPLRGELKGRISPVSEADLPERMCLGEGPFDASSCEGPVGTRWSLFDVDASASRLRLSSADDGAMHLPYRRRAMVDVVHENVQLDGDPAKGAWLAIVSAPRRGRFAASPRIALSPNCDLRDDELSTAARFVATEEWPPPHSPHPVAMEARAILSGADAMVRCPSAEHALVEMPAITRPLMATYDDRLLGPPNFAMEPQQVNIMQVRAWSLAAAFGAVGDWELAAFWAERAIALTPLDTRAEARALRVMDILATGGSLEAAIRLAHHAGRNVWNSANIPDLLDGTAIIHAQLGQTDLYLDQTARKQELAQSRRDDARLAWYRWAELRTAHAARSTSEGLAYREYVVGFESDEQPDWALAIWAMLGMHGQSLPGVESAAELRPRFDRAGALALWHAIFEPDLNGRCDPSNVETCTATSYGLRSRDPNEPDLQETLEAIPTLDLRTSFDVTGVEELASGIQEPASRAKLWIALLPLTDGPGSADALRRALGAVAEVMSTPDPSCERTRALRWHFANAARRGDRPLLGRERRQWVEFVAWWADQGIETLCESPASFMEALRARPTSARTLSREALLLLDARYRAAGPESLEVEELSAASTLAGNLGDADTCARWSLATSVAAARRGHIQLAGEHLVSATNCAPQAPDLRAARDLVAAYIEFERSAGKRGFNHPDAGENLRALARLEPAPDTCVGLVPLNFDLDHHLPTSLHELAGRIALADVSGEAFSVLTASHLLSEARASFTAGVRALARGDALSAARSLQTARQHFGALSHRPGGAAITFLDDLVFGGHLQALATAETEDRSALQLPEAQARLRNGEAALWLNTLSTESPEFGSAAHLAALLIVGRREDAALLAAQPGVERPALLCAPEAAAP